MENFTKIESFTDFEDAYYFMETTLREKAGEDWELQQGSGIQFVNNQWRVGLSWERSVPKSDDQLLKEFIPETVN